MDWLNSLDFVHTDANSRKSKDDLKSFETAWSKTGAATLIKVH